jgi:hypothetical protein
MDEEFAGQGEKVNNLWGIVAEDLQHISPARFKHINPHGRFRFDMKDKLKGKVRPLRTPKGI